MDTLIRIGDKLINRSKIIGELDRILELRATGLSQQEVAKRLSLDRTFISRLEGLGEIRQGCRVAVIGFPIANKDELDAVIQEMAVDFSFVMTDQERWRFVENKTGPELLNTIMDLIMKLRTFDVVVMIGSDLRIKIAQALLDKEVIPLYLGESPIAGDKRVEPEMLRQILQVCRQKSVSMNAGRRGNRD
ncbi:MAG: transcriptional regulator [Bacillota bacterium]|jgi:hypothetical protein